MAINPIQSPINYAAMAPQVDLSKAFSELGTVLAQRQKDQQAGAAKEKFALDVAGARADGSQNAWLGLIASYPQFREAFGDVRKGIGEEQAKNEFFEGMKISNALEAGRSDIAADSLRASIAARKSAGANTQPFDLVLGQIEANELTSAKSSVNEILTMLDPDRFKKTVEARTTSASAPSVIKEAKAKATQEEQKALNAISTAKDDVSKAEAQAQLAIAQADKAKVEAQFAERNQLAALGLNAAQIKNINSEIGTRAAKLNLDTLTMRATVSEKLSSIQKNLTDLPADTRKLVNDSAVAAAAAKQSAGQYNDLAKRLEASGGGYGEATSARDFLNKAFGMQGALTQLRQEYTRIRNSAAIKSLPPGVATDKDIELALKGIPPENADAGTMASFLRGMGKMQDIEASVANSKTDWLANNNGVLTRAKNTFQAGDYATKSGESFNDFTQRVVQDVSKRYDPTQQTSLVQQIPTNANPNPAAVQNKIRSEADAIIRGPK